MDFLSQDILRFQAATAEWTADTLSLGVSFRVCKTSHWGCSVPRHAPLGMDSNSQMKVGEDSDNVRRHLATPFCQTARSDAHG